MCWCKQSNIHLLNCRRSVSLGPELRLILNPSSGFISARSSFDGQSNSTKGCNEEEEEKDLVSHGQIPW